MGYVQYIEKVPIQKGDHERYKYGNFMSDVFPPVSFIFEYQMDLLRQTKCRACANEITVKPYITLMKIMKESNIITV
jgi:hypothetical protein